MRLLGQNEFVVLGENHHRSESTQLVADLAEAFTLSGECLRLALEIVSSEQTTLDLAMAGEASIAAVRVHPIVDHPGYRAMLGRLRELVHDGRCLHVDAIDAPAQVPEGRDEWMANRLTGMIRDAPTLVLVGNLHALKEVRWQSGKDRPFLAERLVRAGRPIASVIQQWEPSCSSAWHAEFIPVSDPRAARALEEVVRPAAVEEPEPSSTTDGAILWRCRR